ncbi:Carbohydrate sulfotransferase 4 [Acropora cervicornis]|uniref:Carbohydrate sulfotransferase 4 n=1 Tax=Acropora cervicornis TaxID=6130 RepID=A0AAD9QWG8_ACRCE|nr:Carbohydrate sulfotransferase 4 [Acropora cervicornis]
MILNACTSRDVDCKIVFLVRDPRAVLPSPKSVGFYSDATGDFSRRGTRLYSYWRCKETKENLEIIRKLDDSLKNSIKLQRYEDLALNPLKALTGLYEFAGLSELESVKTRLNETTRKTRGDCNEMDGEQVMCTKDDAWVAANRWRWKVHPQEISIIEQYCKETMRLMGYTPGDMSSELLWNQAIPI